MTEKKNINKKNHLYLNKAINYIIENFTKPPNLDEVSKISGFSKFHFHRIFKEFTGETLKQFTKRIRLERAAFLLVFHKERSITDIALSCGFSSSQNFATAFKKHFDITAKAYKEKKSCQGIRVHDPHTVSKYDIKLIFLNAFKVVYERSFSAYSNDNFKSKRNKILTEYPDKTYVGIFWDDPAITLEESCRYDHGYIIENNVKPKKLATQAIEANTYIVLTLNFDELTKIDSIEIWNFLYSSWLPRHGYMPNTLFCFETIDAGQIKFHIPIQKI